MKLSFFFLPHLSIATRFAPLLMCKRSWKKACCLNACSLFRVTSSWRKSPSWLEEPRRSSPMCSSFWKLTDPLEDPSPHFPALSSCTITVFSRLLRANGDSAHSKFRNILLYHRFWHSVWYNFHHKYDHWK